jgi:hypothetical protein
MQVDNNLIELYGIGMIVLGFILGSTFGKSWIKKDQQTYHENTDKETH